MSTLESQIAHYLAHRMPAASDVIVDDLGRIYGGSSQETFRFRARWTEAGAVAEHRFILRRDTSAGLVVADRDLEYNVYCALAGHGLPIPAAWFMELDSNWLDRPFFIMDQCPRQARQPVRADGPI